MGRRLVIGVAAAAVVALGLLAASTGRGDGGRARGPGAPTVAIDDEPSGHAVQRVGHDPASSLPAVDTAPTVRTAVAETKPLSPADREALERHERRFGADGPEGPPHWSDSVVGSVAWPPAREQSESARQRRLEQLEALRARELLGVLDAIAAGLAWLKGHQRPDGWFMDSGAALRCVELGHAPPCVAPADRSAEWSMAGTALAVMAFAAFRDQDVNGRFEPALARGVACLRAKQFADGGFPSGVFRASSTLSLIALGRMAAATGDTGLRDAVRRGLACAAREAAPDGGYHYFYEPFGDLRETAWIALAVEEARKAGIEVPEAVAEGLPRFVTSAWLGGHRFARVRGGAEWSAMAPVGILAGLLVWDDGRRADVLPDFRGWVAEPPPTRLYPLYHGVRVAAHLEPDMPQPWRDALLGLMRAQEQSGAATGAWRDLEAYPLSEIGYVGVGVVHTTAFAVLVLEEALRAR